MKTLTIIVPGRPVPKARPRVTSHGTYTPQRTQAHTEWVQAHAREVMAGSPPLTGPIQVMVFHYLKGDPTKRPDLLNLDMLVADALSGIVYQDDSQIIEMTSMKLRSTPEETRIEIQEMT